MSQSTIAIIGSGIVGTAIAYILTSKGYDVDIFEKGPEYPYPHTNQFQEQIKYLYQNPVYSLPKDLKNLTVSGDYRSFPLDEERAMVAGGSATRWAAIALRMRPSDFRTRSLYGYGNDWPISYEDLEPYYCKAEALLGVSGTDADNPFAPPRSQPYPLRPFELGYDDVILAERLHRHGIVLHTTPQARTRQPYDQRPACENFGACHICPIGARYSPNHHLQRAIQTRLCQFRPNVSVRKILVDRSGRTTSLVYQSNDSSTSSEHTARIVILAAGAIESARLLLLSADSPEAVGLGNEAGHVGQHFAFHHNWWNNNIEYKEALYPERFGGWTGQSHQFLDPPTRGRHGGIKVEFASRTYAGKVTRWGTQKEIMEQLRPRVHSRAIILAAESVASPQKYIRLSDQHDRFGDPFAHVHYESAEFDYETHRFAREVHDRFVTATGARETHLSDDANRFGSGAHHMGGCRMGHSVEDSVVDQFGKVHNSPNLFVVGGSNFVGTSGAVNPTLTMVALAFRTADYLLDQLL
jgi:choline dehydrogenase-like flavoprotein